MVFSEKLNEYMEKTGCTAKELSECSGVSAASLSRYRSGERVPEINSDVFERICAALSDIAREKGIEFVDIDSVRTEMLKCSDMISFDREVFRRNLDTAMTVLNIGTAKLAAFINYESSTVFRIRNGTRRPADPQRFIKNVADFFAECASEDADFSVSLMFLLGCGTEQPDSREELSALIEKWLLTEHPDGESDVSAFLSKLDEFDLNAYIKKTHYDELKVPSLPFRLYGSKSYYGIKEMMNAELDFIKTTVLSKSMAPVTLYSDMPMEKMASDPEFPKKWIFGMALVLKKGLQLNIIHNVNRPFREMMLGLEGWIPMYMTGQITPYYLKNTVNGDFLHYLFVSGDAALSGEAIAGHFGEGKYYLTRNKDEIKYYSRRAADLIGNASPLMDIYTEEKVNAYYGFVASSEKSAGSRRSILSAPPIEAADETLLRRICGHNNVSDELTEKIIGFLRQKQKTADRLSKNGFAQTVEVPVISRKEFEKYPVSLPLADIFCPTDIKYTYEEYCEHMERVEEYARTHSGYTLKKSTTAAFRNLCIQIHEGQYVIISKERCPAIHFVIRHPRLCKAVEAFTPILYSEEEK